MGSDGFGKIYFDNYHLVQTIGIVALSYILFMGGLSVEIKEIKPVFFRGLSLATVGVFITAMLTGFITHKFLNLGLKECFLLGAIISSTDAAAVFSVLRSKNISLKNNLKPLLEFESGSNDPMAVFLTLGVISLITGAAKGLISLCFMLIKQMILGILIGILIGKFAVWLINKIKLEYNGLYVVITTGIVLLSYSLSEILGGNGFMSVYVTGLTMAAAKFVHKKMLIKFHDGIAWLMQIAMFTALGLLVFIKEAYSIIKSALLVACILMFISRPVSVFLSLMPFRMNIKEKLMISWTGLRGAAPIVLATFPLTYGIKNSHTIFDIVFFVVIISVILQGSTIPLMAKLLGVDAPVSDKFYSPIEFEGDGSGKKMLELQISRKSQLVHKPLKDIKLPEDTLVAMFSRNGENHIPSGNTIFEECDIVTVFLEGKNEDKIREIFS